MGGKTWQAEEEHFFWRVLVPQSPEGVEPSERRYSWKECAELMQRELGHRQFRAYNKQLLYEHFYQNCKSERPSPRAKFFVREYLAARGPVPIERTRLTSRGRQPTEAQSSAAASATPRATEGRQAGPVHADQSPRHGIWTPDNTFVRNASQFIAAPAPAMEPNTTFLDSNRATTYAPVSFTGRAPLPLDSMPRPSFSEEPTQAPSPAYFPAPVLAPLHLGDQLPHDRAVRKEAYEGVVPAQPKGQYQVARYSSQPYAPMVQEGSKESSGFQENQELTYRPPTGTTTQSSAEASASKDHGPLFEALLQVTGANSMETSPETTSSGRSKSISSSSTVSYDGERCSKAHGKSQQGAV